MTMILFVVISLRTGATYERLLAQWKSLYLWRPWQRLYKKGLISEGNDCWWWPYGLTAAYYLGHAKPDWQIQLYEQAPRFVAKFKRNK